MACFCSAAFRVYMVACERESVGCHQFRSEKENRSYFEFLSFALFIVLKLIHVLLELLGLCLGPCLLLLCGLDGDLHLCDGPLELCYLRANLKQGGGRFIKGRPKGR